MRTAIAIAACLLAASACAPHAHVAAGMRVIDGDTIDWNGTRWRMSNYDTPEINGHCQHERDLAWRAKHRLQDLLRGPFTVTPVRCWHGYTRDRYGRRYAVVRVAGQDVGDILIRERLAVSFPQPSRWRPWCQGESQ